MIEEIIKTFTRYILPGFAFYIACIAIPATLLDSTWWAVLVNQTNLVVVGIVSGFVLDGIGSYRYTIHHRAYATARASMIAAFNESTTQDTTSDDPDAHLAGLWVSDEATYNRIFHERAEWVSILNTACVMLAAAIVSFSTAVHLFLQGKFSAFLLAFLYAGFSLAISWALSRTGTQRMRAHNLKAVAAVKGARAPFTQA